MIWEAAGDEAIAAVRAWLKSERWEEMEGHVSVTQKPTFTIVRPVLSWKKPTPSWIRPT